MKADLTLDPDDWNAFAEVAHRALDESIEYLRTVRERPVWQPVPQDVRDRLSGGIPVAPSELGEVYEEFKRDVLPYPTGNIHPRFWGFVKGSGAPSSLVSDILASTMNTNAAGFEQSSTYVERQVLSWFAQLFGFPKSTGGVLTTGATTANMTALVVARNARAANDVKKNGVAQAGRLRIYASTETHTWIKKAANVLGLGENAIHFIKVDEHFRIDVADLAAAIAEDRANGFIPLCVNANAGTVNTGAVDDLVAVADLCERESLWLHVDGAFGAMAVLAPERKEMLAGIERADSIAFDVHKWGYLSYEVACVLVRDGDAHTAALSNSAPYLSKGLSDGIASIGTVFADRSFDLSRGFRALRPWFALKTYGTAQLGAMIAQNIDQARYMAQRIQEAPELELLDDPPLNIVCFRYKAAPGTDANELNMAIVNALQHSGEAVFTGAVLHGQFAIRAAITNHRTTLADIDLALRAVQREGRRLGVVARVDLAEANGVH